MSLLKDLLKEADATADDFDPQTVLAKLTSAEKNNKVAKDSVAFALEEIDKDTGDTRLVKVYIGKDQANDFEAALAAALDEFGGKKEIAEILYDLRAKFNIVNVEWPDIPEDEEVDQSVATNDQQSTGDVNAQGDQMAADAQTADVAPVADEEGVKSTLAAVIDMMKADAEARKAEAEAKAAEYSAQASMSKVKSEEQILDMETYYKEKDAKKKEAEQLAKLAKYKHDLAQDSSNDTIPSDSTASADNAPNVSISKTEVNPATPTAPEEEEVAVPTQLKPDANKDGYLKNSEFLKFVDLFLKRNSAQR